MSAAWRNLNIGPAFRKPSAGDAGPGFPKHSRTTHSGKGEVCGEPGQLVACPPKAGPVLMGVVQLAESQGATHAKTTQPRPDRQDPPRSPGRPRGRLECQSSLPQGRLRSDGDFSTTTGSWGMKKPGRSLKIKEKCF